MLCQYLNSSYCTVTQHLCNLKKTQIESLYLFTPFILFSIWHEAKLWKMQARQDLLSRQLISSDAKFLLNPLTLASLISSHGVPSKPGWMGELVLRPYN